jgi:hypothetical protein
MNKIINLTPHAVNIGDRVFPASGQLARVDVSLSPVGEHDGIPLVCGTYGDVTGLPPQQGDVIYIVSAMVRAALPHRKDLASPAKLIRNKAGKITGCAALEINP